MAKYNTHIICGRYSLASDMTGLEERFAFESQGLSYQPRFNIAPTQEVLTVTADQTGNQARFMRWRLIPYWAKDASIGNRIINARAETLTERSAFRHFRNAAAL